MAVRHDGHVPEDERHPRRVQNLLLRLGLDGIPGQEDDGLFVDAIHHERDAPIRASRICRAASSIRRVPLVPLRIIGVDADQNVRRDEITLLASPQLPDGNRDDENDGGERQPEKHVRRK
jgi:hypothetical protein